MPSFRTGTVERVVATRSDVQVLDVRVGAEIRPALLYARYAAPAAPGDRVVVNTTAVDLGLGTGGWDFVVWNLAVDSHDSLSGGHIMKLRYTPLQADVVAVESPESPHHEELRDGRLVHGLVVVAASLHSQLLPVVAALRASRPDAVVVYVMTEGAALELSFSSTVRRLRELGWLHAAVTAGNALGGDVEAVNVYSALLAARSALGADVAVVGMGPGVVGTGTSLGTTAVDLGTTLNAAAALDGRPVAAVRMSSADVRERHAGVSHHALVALDRLTLVPVDIPVPRGLGAELDALAARHRVVEVDAEAVLLELQHAAAEGLLPKHMERGPEEDPLFFLAAGAAGYHAASLLG